MSWCSWRQPDWQSPWGIRTWPLTGSGNQTDLKDLGLTPSPSVLRRRESLDNVRFLVFIFHFFIEAKQNTVKYTSFSAQVDAFSVREYLMNFSLRSK
jgi:hypothetical protein